MPKKRFSAEQIVMLLRQIEVSMAQAPNGSASRGYQCPVIGVKQTQCGHAAISKSHPKLPPHRIDNDRLTADLR